VKESQVTAIVVPDDFPSYLTGTPAEARLRALGDVTLYNRDAPRDADDLIRRCTDAEIVYNIYGASRFTEPVLVALKRSRLISAPNFIVCAPRVSEMLSVACIEVS